MPKSTLDLETEMGKKTNFVAPWASQGDKRIIIIPKHLHASIEKFKNPLKITVEEILD
jgi:hypothetical protein